MIGIANILESLDLLGDQSERRKMFHSKPATIDVEEIVASVGMYLLHPSATIIILYKPRLFIEVQLVWIQSFPFQRMVACPRTQSALLYIHSWDENRWINAFPRDTSEKGKENIPSIIWNQIVDSIS